MPLAILAKVLAERGAITIMSAHLRNSLCKINLSYGFLGFLGAVPVVDVLVLPC